MATTFPQSTLQSSNNQHSTPVFVGVGLVVGGLALGGILIESGHYVGEHGCQPRVELCAPADKLWLPDGSEKDPSNPIGKLGTGTVVTSTASSTVSPTNTVVPVTAK